MNRHRSYDHKVPRSRASTAAVLRGSARPTFSAGSPWIELAVLRRCLGGQALTSTAPRCSPLIDAVHEESVSAEGLRQLRTPKVCGNLTAGSTATAAL